MNELNRLPMILLLSGASFMLLGSADARQTDCGTHQNIGLQNGFMLANNNWGSEGHPGSPFQCVYRDPDGTIGWF